MTIDILTLFPPMFQGPLSESILKRAQDPKLHQGKPPLTINIHNLRQWASDPHKMVDDRPFGGGPGMVLMVKPIYLALKELTKTNPFSKKWTGPARKKKNRIILTTPQGPTFNQQIAVELSRLTRLIIITGHYKGVDERVRQRFIDQEISIGDYVLTGGELPAMVMIDALARFIPGVIGKMASVEEESFSLKHQNKKLLGFPQYTRPAEFKGLKVPQVLLTGNHAKIAKWRLEQALKSTKRKRPELLGAQK